MAIIEAAAYALPRTTLDETYAVDETTPPVRAEWPPQVAGWQGVSDMPPFESHRGELLLPNDDAFS